MELDSVMWRFWLLRQALGKTREFGRELRQALGKTRGSGQELRQALGKTANPGPENNGFGCQNHRFWHNRVNPPPKIVEVP